MLYAFWAFGSLFGMPGLQVQFPAVASRPLSVRPSIHRLPLVCPLNLIWKIGFGVGLPGAPYTVEAESFRKVWLLAEVRNDTMIPVTHSPGPRALICECSYGLAGNPSEATPILEQLGAARFRLILWAFRRSCSGEEG